MFRMKAFTNFYLFTFRSDLHRQVQCQNVLLLTQDPDAVLQGLHAAGLHGHAEHRLLPADGAHLVLLGCLLEHDQELVGNDGVEHGNDNHGEHEGDESVDLRERDVAQSGRRNGQWSGLCFISHGSRGATCSGNLFLPLTLLPLVLETYWAQRKLSLRWHTFIQVGQCSWKSNSLAPNYIFFPFSVLFIATNVTTKTCCYLSILQAVGCFLAFIVRSMNSK